MLIGVALRRLLREWQRMAVLLLAISLVAGFLALAPLYVRAIGGAELALRLERFDGSSRVQFLNETPISDSMTDTVNAQLGDGVMQNDNSADGIHIYNSSLQEVENDLLVIQASAYREFDSLFTLVEGRLPDADSDVVEIVITTDVLNGINTLNDNPRYTEYGIGEQLAVITDLNTPLSMEIVGIVEATVPRDDPFWTPLEGGQVFGTPRQISQGLALVDALAFSVLTTEQIYEEQIAPDVETQYIWQFVVDTPTINYDTINTIGAQIDAVQAELRRLHPESEVRSALFQLIINFNDDIDQLIPPVLLLSLLALSLMLYNLVTTISLILEQQSQEWATIASRGGSHSQLMQIHGLSMLALCVVAALLGPLIAQVILLILSVIGPQAEVIDSELARGITGQAFLLSGIAAALAWLMLTTPAYSLLRTSLLELKRSTSRPPDQPIWARFFLDVILIVIGSGFMLRLYTLSADVDEPLRALLEDPGTLVRALSEQGAAGLDDPFSLLGPALLLTGLALLWMRVFPWIMSLIGLMLSGVSDLTTRLALWNVERNPSHYAQLVLLIIGTLALGTASLTLIETRDSGALTIAQQETGGDVRVSLDPATAETHHNWLSIPGTISAVPLLVQDYPDSAPNRRTSLVGLPAADFIDTNPAYADTFAPLLAAEPPSERGLLLADDLTTLTVDVYTEAIEETDQIETTLTLLLLNPDEVTVSLPMMSENPVQTDTWMAYSAALPANGGPWRFIGFQLDHALAVEGDLQVATFLPTTYLDNLQSTQADGTTLTVHGFEEADYADWAWSARVRLQGPILTSAENFTTEGAASLRATYRNNPGSSQVPVLTYGLGDPTPIPALVTEAWAQTIGQRRGTGVLDVGDIVTTELEVSMTQSRSVNYVIVGILDALPTFNDSDLLLVTERQWLQRQLNDNTTVQTAFGVNQVWLDLENAEPTTEQIDTIAALPGFVEAAYAWERFQAIQRDPLANTLTGMLFAGFWVSLGLILLDFAFYMAVTTERRSLSMAVLRSMGWERQNIWRMLTVEQAAFITPALIVGFGLGAVIAYLILPFLGLVGNETLQIPLLDVLVLLVALVLTFTVLLAITAVNLQRMDVNAALRQQE